MFCRAYWQQEKKKKENYQLDDTVLMYHQILKTYIERNVK